MKSALGQELHKELFPELGISELLRIWSAPPAAASGARADLTQCLATLGGAIAANHHENGMLWYHEDRVRCPHASDATIVKHKRAIDGHNRQRNQAAEAIDEHIYERLTFVKVRREARRYSETPGSIVDRLSIASLRLSALHILVSDARRPTTQQELSRKAAAQVTRQREDLQQCLGELLEELIEGRARLRLYRHFKLYDDPNCNAFLARR